MSGSTIVGATFLLMGYMVADGRCLPIKEYPQLAETLHDGDNWPYGRCNYNSGFRLPDLLSKNKGSGVPLIRVKP